MTIEIKGLKKAVGEYKWANKSGRGPLDPWHGKLMMDLRDGEIWTDTLYGDEFIVYHRDTIINLGSLMSGRGIKISMANVKEFVQKNYDKIYDKENDKLKDDFDWA